MARRQIEEINAGSMADIAFLLLIFFLVTTTMEVDAGISRDLPYKRDLPPDYVPPEIHNRDILVIMANSRDELLVEDKPMLIENLEAKVKSFYMDNSSGIDVNPEMPLWDVVTGQICQQKIQEYTTAIELEKDTKVKGYLKDDLDKWEKRKATFETIGPYKEISGAAVIQLKNQSNTSYGLYIDIQNILKKVVNDLRDEKCRELGWGEYRDLDVKEDTDKINVLKVLVPERIIEAKIEI